jgi:hypothetical protein
MTTYVDPIFTWKDGKQWCHMIADTEAELIASAAMLGLKREWLHVSSSGIRHFDLTPRKRALAIKHGAIEVTGGEFIAIGYRNRDRDKS